MQSRDEKYTVFAAATKKELRNAFSHLSPPLSHLEIGKPVPWKWQNRHFLLLPTGIGTINAALNLGKLLGNSWQLNGIVNIGVAGSMDLELYPLKTPVLIAEEIWPEFGLKEQDGIYPEKLEIPLGYRAGKKFWNRIGFDSLKNIRNLGLNLRENLPVTSSITVAGVTGDLKQAREFRSRYNVGLENMEGFALAWASSLANLPFGELRIVSNLVGSRNQQDRDFQGALEALGIVCKDLINSPD